MKKTSLLLLLAWVLVVDAYGQNQLNTWTVGLTDIKMSANPITTAPIKNSTLPLLQNFNIRNSICDRNGDVIFYVGENKIVDRFGKLVSELEDVQGQILIGNDYNPEMAIVPCIESNSQECLKKYYVFYTRFSMLPQSYRTVLYAKIVSVNCNTGQVTAQDVVDPSNPTVRREIYHVSSPTPILGTIGSFAVSKQQGLSRFLYYISEPSIQKITLSDVNSPNQGISNPILMVSRTNATGFSFGDCQQANLSTKGDKLAWAVRQNANKIDYFVIGINPATGDFNGTKNIYPFITPAPSFETTLIKGVEFSEDGTLLYTSSTQGLYYLNLTGGSGVFNQIASISLGYTDSQLELGPDGKVYARRSNSIASISKNGTSFPTSIIPITSVFSGQGQPHTLPDQIDGENYTSYQVADFFDVDDYTFTKPQVSGTIIYTQTSNPINATGSPIRLTGITRIGDTSVSWGSSLTPVTYIFDNMTFEMSKDAIFEILNNVEVHFLGCTFKSAPCSGLWRGIEVKGNSALIADRTNAFPKFTKINDAISGIKISGGNSTFILNGVEFNNNLTSLKIIDYKPYAGNNGADINLCVFFQTDTLKKSPLENLTPSNIFGNIGIDLSTTKEPDSIILKVGGSRFQGGKTGIYVNKAPIIMDSSDNNGVIVRNQFFNINQGEAIRVVMERKNYPVIIKKSLFDKVRTAITTSGKINLRIAENTFENTRRHTIKIDKNNNGKIDIHNNNFKKFYQSAVFITNSATITDYESILISTTFIHIHNNLFNAGEILSLENTDYNQFDKPTAITLSETNLPSALSPTYGFLLINRNVANNVAYGVRTANITGYYSTNKTNYLIPTLLTAEVSNIHDNTWNVYATYTPSGPIPSDYNTSILAVNSSKLRIALNKISSNQYIQWRSPGIYLDNARSLLVYKNTIQSGRGVGGRFLGLGTDISCNSFIRNVNGISLQDYQLRENVNSIHGQQGIASRDNYYAGTRDNDIELYTWEYNGWQPSVLQGIINSNQWTMVFSPSVLIEPNPNTVLGGAQSNINYIRTGSAPDLCGLPDTWNPNDPQPLISQPPQSDDAFQQWMLQYEYIREQQALTGNIGNTFIDQLLVLQRHISQGNIPVAVNTLNSMPQPSNVFEQNIKNVYQIWLTAQSENRNLNEAEVAEMVQIATPNTYEIGLASYIARAILWEQEGLNFVDMVDRKNAGIGIKVNFAPCHEDLPSNFTIELKDENNTIYPASSVPIQLDAEGYAYIAPQHVSTLSPNLLYTFHLQGGEYTSPPLQSLHNWMDNAQDNTISICNFGKSGGNDIVQKPMQKPILQIMENNIAIYPNPAKDNIAIQLPSEGEYQVSIYDALGKQVFSQQLKGKPLLPITQYEAGVYFVKIQNASGDKMYHNRLLIVK